jgi:hypothetical protein
MGPLGRYLARRKARRMDLAMKQIEGERLIEDLAAQNPATDAFTGEYYASRSAMGRLLNPKAKSKTEWRGD